MATVQYLKDRTEKNLKNVHPHLCLIVRRAFDMAPLKNFCVIQGARTVEEQKINVAHGASQTMRSRHIIAENGFAHAVDFCFIIPNDKGKDVARWDTPLFVGLSKLMKAASAEFLAAKKIRAPVEWGGDWRTFKDHPHFQLNWKLYPGTKGT